MAAREAEGGGTGSARRRRERRLRAYLKYARMSVAMALAECSHHSAPRGQRTATAREEDPEVHSRAGALRPLRRARRGAAAPVGGAAGGAITGGLRRFLMSQCCSSCRWSSTSTGSSSAPTSTQWTFPFLRLWGSSLRCTCRRLFLRSEIRNDSVGCCCKLLLRCDFRSKLRSMLSTSQCSRVFLRSEFRREFRN